MPRSLQRQQALPQVPQVQASRRERLQRAPPRQAARPRVQAAAAPVAFSRSSSASSALLSGGLAINTSSLQRGVTQSMGWANGELGWFSAAANGEREAAEAEAAAAAAEAGDVDEAAKLTYLRNLTFIMSSTRHLNATYSSLIEHAVRLCLPAFLPSHSIHPPVSCPTVVASHASTGAMWLAADDPCLLALARACLVGAPC